MFEGIFDSIQNLINGSGFGLQYWQNYLMILIACFLLFLAIVKKYEPLLLVPIAFGMILANLPLAGLMGMPTNEMIAIPVNDLIQATGKTLDEIRQTFSADQINDVLNALHPGDTHSYPIVWQAVQDQMLPFWNKPAQNGGLLYYLYQGVKLGIYPPLIFLGIGAMTDFGPLIANPKSFLLGAAAQMGIFITFFCAVLLAFPNNEAASIAIIGGADGPTAIYVT